MKLKFNKQKIASLRITNQLFGGDTTNGGEPNNTSDMSNGLPTNVNNCRITEQPECTSIKDPDNCHTNDSTLKTWYPNENSIRTRARLC